MKVAYLIDRESLGGGCEYVRRRCEERRAAHDDCRTFYLSRGQCTVSALDAWGADEIVVNHLKALIRLLWNPWRRPKGKIRFVVHGIHLRKYEWLMREGGAIGIRVLPMRWLRRGLESRFYHRCDEIVALTESDCADILRWYGRDLNVVIEPNTLDGWNPQSNAELPPGVDGPFAYICIARFDYQKGQDRWIRHVAAEGLAGRTLFVGGGETLKSCRSLARKLGVEDRFAFAGAIPGADRYLKGADVVVSPSRWEGMPYLLMKARALGCRILATDCPGNREVLAGYEKWERLGLRK